MVSRAVDMAAASVVVVVVVDDVQALTRTRTRRDYRSGARSAFSILATTTTYRHHTARWRRVKAN